MLQVSLIAKQSYRLKGISSYSHLSSLSQIKNSKPSFIFHSKNNFSSFASNALNFQLTPQIYTQRAYTPSYISQLFIKQITVPLHNPNVQLRNDQKQLILHQLTLYHQKILPFDYDYFIESLKRLIPHQDQLILEDIVMLFDMASEYQIDNQILKTHFLNQLHCRLYTNVKKQLLSYDKKLQSQQNQFYRQLQTKSDYHFGIVQEKFKQLLSGQKKENQQSQAKQSQLLQNRQNEQQQNQLSAQAQPYLLYQQSLATLSKPIYNASTRRGKSKNIPSKMLGKISQIFLSSGSKNMPLNKLLLEVFTIRLDQQIQKQLQLQQKPFLNQKKQSISENSQLQLSPSLLILYSRLTVNLLQLCMSQFHLEQNQSKFTHRSIKRIYKLQAFYYFQIAQLVQEKNLLSQATNEQLAEFVDVLASFPIKRRSFRKSLGFVLIEEFKKRQILPETLLKFFQLSRYDNQLLEIFEKQINKDKLLQDSSQIIRAQLDSKLSQTSKSQQDGLIPQIVDQQSLKLSQSMFKMPNQLFRKVTKKKSKPKMFVGQFNSKEQYIDLTNQVENNQENIETTKSQQVEPLQKQNENNLKAQSSNSN